MTRIYLIRHAHAEGNLYRRIHGRYNSLLTETGWRQVEALEKRFESIHIDAVYSSPLHRCCSTARAVYVPKGLPLNMEPGLAEINMGRWEDVTFGQAQTHEPVLNRLFAEASPLYSIEGGETFAQVQQRIVSALFRLAEQNPGRTLACFTHAMAMKTAMTWFHGYGVEDMGKTPLNDNTAVSCIDIDGRNARIVFESDNSHLREAGLSTVITHKRPGEEKTVFAFGHTNMWFRPWKPYLEKDLYIGYRHEAWIDIHGTEEPFDGDAFYQKALTSSEDDPRSVMLAYIGNELVGVIQMDLDRDAGEGVCFVPFVYMNPDNRHRGFGVQLIGQAVSTARSLGRDKLRLRCAPTNEIAKRFYDRYGFYQIGMADDSKVPLMLMEKYIGYEHR